MALVEELADIVGSEYVSDEPEALDAYSKDESFVTPLKPRVIVKPKNANEVQAIVRWANQTATPLVPVSSGPPRFRGDTVPSVGGAIIVDLGRMKRIIRIDRRNRMTIVEPGVTFAELLPELAKEGLKLPIPLAPRSSKSVVASLLEREPTLIPKYGWQLADPLRCTEIVWGNGDILMTGEAGSYNSLEQMWKLRLAPVDPIGPEQVDYYRFVQAAQGSMGIVTWASVRCGVLPQLQKLFFVSSERLDGLLSFAYRLLKLKYADELLLLNGSNLASLLGEGADEIRALKEELPQWVFILCIAGYDRLPKERVEFQEKDITDIAQQFGHRLVSTIPGAKDRQVLEILSGASKDPYWKLRYRGGYHDIFFLTTLNKTPELVKAMYSLSKEAGYSTSDIGIYIQPLMQGVACHCEFVLPFEPGNPSEVSKVKKLVTEGSKALMKEGAFFSRPYGTWADMAYNEDAQTTIALKKIKGIFDPNNVMNPGKLCF